DKMNGTQVATFLIVTVFAFGGYHAFSEWNTAQLEVARLEAQQRKDETHAKIVARLADVNGGQQLGSESARMQFRATEGYRAIVASAPDATSMNIQGTNFNADELAHIRSEAPKQRVRRESREEVYVEMIKRNTGYLSLTLRLPDQEYSFPGRVDLSTFDQDKLPELFDALKNASTIRLFHYPLMENEKILRTSVLAVDDISI